MQQTLSPAPKTQTTGAVAASAIQLKLVQSAIQAASSHNTQPWLFRLNANGIDIVPDYSRRCPYVDSDDHHLFASLGCATENLVLAARAHGLETTVSFDVLTSSVKVEFLPSVTVQTPEYAAIPLRQCSRTLYDGERLATDELTSLSRAAQGNGVSGLMITSAELKKVVIEYVSRGNTAQFSDTGWSAEMRQWIRFNNREATRRGDGLYGRVLGIPNLPGWLGRLLMPLATSATRQNAKDARYIRSSAAVLVFSSGEDNRAHWVEAGRCCQRVMLCATHLGINTAFINQPVEVPSLRTEFAAALGLTGRRPDLILRLGRGPTAARSKRRPINDVVIGMNDVNEPSAQTTTPGVQ